MAILVTRPYPDNEKTAQGLRARGFDVLVSPALRLEPLPFHYDTEVNYDAVIVTSANAVRAVQDDPALGPLHGLKLFAVGDASAQMARQAGFTNVVSASGDGAALREAVTAGLKKGTTLCYLAGADLGRDLTIELGERGYTVITHTTYRMMPVPVFDDAAMTAFKTNSVDAVLHYSRRSARSFVEAAQASGIEILALALRHVCISETVASILREAGAGRIVVARAPDENAIFEALDRALGAAS
ncbi:MAG: uroporphyrinogen-III synthase [Bradyrhizobiaceae bacterium]|nr:MAG: uroporphyrinogen-III synthase [Bradyrhizobiaceae bacterium]